MDAYDSFFIDQTAARQAVQLVLPMIEAAMQSREAGASGFLYIVIMRPGSVPATDVFEDAILLEHAVGDRARWDADYAAFARAKARVSWRTGRDAHLVAAVAPHWLAPGDTVLWGAVARDGLVVGVSGADPWYDEVFAGAIALCLQGLAKKRMAGVQDHLFLPSTIG